ncbi:MAG: MATE family efflux transporter [Oscillospiraceae bacterium]|nr:MATE family efflux transporter [Oscillospiraceae bacterium]
MAQLQKRRSHEIDMCSGPLLKKILAFALPLATSSVLQLLFNAADIVVVGRWAGDNALAAVGSNASLINLLINLFIGLSVGTNILCARFVGAQNTAAVRSTVHTSMLLALLSGVFLAVVGFFAAAPLLQLMQVPPSILPLSTLYLKIYFLGMPATMLYNFGAALLRSIGDTRRPLLFLFLSGVVNVGLNLIFVIVFSMSVAGVALATVISQVLSAALVVRCLCREEGDIRLELKALRIDTLRLKQIAAIGIPSGLQNVAFALSNVIIQSSINGFGETVISGNTAAANIDSFVFAAFNAFYQANVAFTSQNYGAGRWERIRPIAVRCVGCSAITALLLGGGAFVFGRPLLSIYTHSDAVIAAGMLRIAYICLPYVLGALMDSLVGSVRGIGYSVLPTVVTLLGACGLRILMIATVFRLPAFHTPALIYFTYPLTWTVTFLAHLVCFTVGMHRLRRRSSTWQHYHMTKQTH